MTPIEQTQAWVNDIVIELNFCPFARREVVNNRVRYAELPLTTLTELYDVLHRELNHLDNQPSTETTLIIFPQGCEDFQEFLFVIEEANLYMQREGYEGVYQLAHFHPEYQFEGDSLEAASNYTNRAPFPTLHLIREASLQAVLNDREDSDDIVERNIKKAEQLGSAFFVAKLAEYKNA